LCVYAWLVWPLRKRRPTEFLHLFLLLFDPASKHAPRFRFSPSALRDPKEVTLSPVVDQPSSEFST
jgi:hypothetical protein